MRHPTPQILAATCLLLSAQGPAARASSTAETSAARISMLAVPAEGRTGFTTMLPAGTGVSFTNVLTGDLSLTNAVAHNGSGVAIGDVDADGQADLYFCCLDGPNRLYRNLGDWRFAELPIGGAACDGQLSTGAAFADVDGDADLDLLVNGIAAGTRLFLNDGGGHWTEATNTGLSRTASPTSLALADIDGDGDLDLYCTHYIDVMHLADPTIRFALGRSGDEWRITKVNGQPTTLPYWKDRFQVLPGGRVRELPEPDGFYRNDGAGRFTAIGNESGRFRNAAGEPVGPFRDWGLSVMFRDLNGDGAPDFHVCNDNASPDRLWLNAGDGTFREPPPFTFRHTSRSSMALDFADVDRDGQDDLLVLDMLARSPERRMRQLVRDLPDPAAAERAEEVPRFNRNMLYLGRPDGSFDEAALYAGVAATDWSWCPIFLDVDLDGYEDLLVANGFEFDVMDQDSVDALRGMRLSVEQRKRFRQFHPAWPTENVAFHNRGDGTFEEAGKLWGFDRAGVSNGMAAGDLDSDGDLDVVANNLNGVASLYRNESAAGRLAVRLQGRAPNTAGIGARLRLTGGPVAQSQEMIAGGRYLSGDETLRVFAADTSGNREWKLEVTWRSGRQTTLTVQPNTLCEVIEPNPATGEAAVPKSEIRTPETRPWFRDLSRLLGHGHVEDGFDDWNRQPLLPRRLSRLGPGVAWCDANDDGWEDLAISAATGGRLAVFLNQQGRAFQRVDVGPATAGDQGAILEWPGGTGNRSLLVTRSNYENGPGTTAAVEALPLTGFPSGRPGLDASGPAIADGSPGPLALADVDGDGDLDCFVGGRHRPDRYPEPPGSSLWLNDAGTLRLDAARSRAFAAAGMVTGATFADLDGDGDADLALAIEWGPVRTFRNDAGEFAETTRAWGFAERTGCWTGITAGDFDGDGRLDLAVGNRGRNSLDELDRSPAIRLFYGDFDEDGSVEIVEAWQDGAQWRPTRTRPWLARGFPDLPQRIATHEAFGQATIQEVLGPAFAAARHVEARCLDAGVFLNRGTDFEWRPLPRAAQLAPIFAVNTGDFNGDGHEDLFLGQNFFGTSSDLSREDGGRGLWLAGHGDGTFSSVATGVLALGEQRAAALADFDHDGRIDLALSQNNGPTLLYRNERAEPGLRVILRGPPLNPRGIGAQMRLRFNDGSSGPVRAVQAGSGYWSQDAATQVLGSDRRPVALWIRWPDGSEKVVSLEGHSREVRVSFADGKD